MNDLLTKSPYNCYLAGWGIKPYNNNNNNSTLMVKNYDAAHVTPIEFPRFVEQNVSTFSDWYRVTGGQNPSEVVKEWKSFTVVRNPYLRVLGAYHQRMRGDYDEVWGRDYPEPSSFPIFMTWMEQQLKSGNMTWEDTPSITHFRPSSMFTHGDASASNDGGRKQIIQTILKLESIKEEFPKFLIHHFYGPEAWKESIRHNRPNTNNPPPGKIKSRRKLCDSGNACDENDLEYLLGTEHTEETIRITNRLYKSDFVLFGYPMLLIDGHVSA